MAGRVNRMPEEAEERFFLRLENAAAASLLAEILTTPKPGLVDQEDNGAHRDMNLTTFIRSTGAVSPYFREMAEAAYTLGDDPEAIFPAVREIGKMAEKAMYAATGGVNTHKGMIFSIGLISAAAGLCFRMGKGAACGDPAGCGSSAAPALRRSCSAEELLRLSGEIARKAMNRDFARMAVPDRRAAAPDGGMAAPATHGELLYSRYGEQGIRGEAKEGFPVLREKALPMLRRCRKDEVSENCANLDILLAVMTCLHAICGMSIVFLQKDGTRLDLYPKQNMRTILQRVSAAMIFPLLILHINTFQLLQFSVGKGMYLLFGLLIFMEVLFFATVITHVAVSITGALITLGILSSRKKQIILDRIIYIIGALAFVIAVIAVVKGQITMFIG